MKGSLVYIGNKTKGRNDRTVTTLDTLMEHFQAEGLSVVSASHYTWKPLRLVHMLWTVLTKGRNAGKVLIDCYSTQNFYYAVAVGGLCRLLRIPYFPILHGGNLPERLQRSPRWSRALFSGAKMNVAPSRYLLEAFRKEGFNNVILIPNTFELMHYPFQAENRVAPKLLWVRSFARIYNPMLAVQVLEQLLHHFPEAELCMVGPDKDGSLPQCKAYAEERNLNVTFTGKLSKESWIDLSKDYGLFLNTTNFDNTPVSVMEAMALGLPIVSTNVGGIPFLLAHEKDALLVPPNDAKAMVAAIVSLCKEPDKAVSLSKQARRKVEHFDWKIVREEWLKLLRD